MIALLAVVVISSLESFSLSQIIFEVVSAENTVGVTMGITRDFSSLSKLILMFLMFIGRIGGLTLALLFLEEANSAPISRPTEKILVG
jgi:Trk-type K+ transport system membrane component